MDTIPTIPGYHINRWGDLQKAKEKRMKYKAFECPECGCQFEADKEHYKYDCGGYNEEWYTTDCPCCGCSVST